MKNLNMMIGKELTKRGGIQVLKTNEEQIILSIVTLVTCSLSNTS